MANLLSIDDVFDNLCDRDQTTELIGFIDEIYAATEVGQKKKYKLFKFVLSNVRKRILCLIWGDELIKKYQNELVINRVCFTKNLFYTCLNIIFHN